MNVVLLKKFKSFFLNSYTNTQKMFFIVKVTSNICKSQICGCFDCEEHIRDLNVTDTENLVWYVNNTDY